MRPEKVDRVKKKHLDTKKNKEKGKDDENSLMPDSDARNVDISDLVEECLLEHKIEDGLDLRGCLTLKLTHEEEFKIFELHVRKENLNDVLFRLFFHFPGFLESFQQSLLVQGLHHDFIRIMDHKSLFVESNLAGSGTIRQSLDMFDQFKNVSENIKNQVLQFSVSVFRVCNR
jgi:hypothetical protein